MDRTIDNPPVIGVAVGVVAERRQGCVRVLITQRRKRSILGGYWEFPGGKIECGETAKQCVAREIREELGLIVRVDEPLLVVQHNYAHGRVRLESFYCTRQSEKLRNIEVAQHRWVLPNQLHHYQFPPANRALVERLIVDL